MSRTTAATVESSLRSALTGFKESASAVKKAHQDAEKAIRDDPRVTDLGKRESLEKLKAETRGKLDAIKSEQASYIAGLRDTVERQFRGSQPSDASSVLLRRDAADRARKITDKQEALNVLKDAIYNGDDAMAHAMGIRARNSGWADVGETYQAAYPDTSDSAEALAYVEGLSKDPAFNVSNSITFSDPS